MNWRDLRLELEYVPLSELTVYADNPRVHDEEQLRALQATIESLGFNQPIGVDDNLGIITGHGRRIVAERLGYTEVPVVRLSHLSPEQLRAYVTLDNKMSDMGKWDERALAKELESLSDLFEFKDFGYTQSELDGILASLTSETFPQEDSGRGVEGGGESEQITAGAEGESIYDTESSREEPEEPEPGILNPREIVPDEVANEIETEVEPRCKLGDIWKLGEHRLICGDSTSKATVERLFGSDTAKLCFTSPPYSDQRTYRGGKELCTEHLAKFISAAKECVDLFAVNLGLSRKDHEVQTYWDDYIAEARGAGLKLLSWNVWDRGEAGSVGNQTAMFAIFHEWIFVFGLKSRPINLTLPNTDLRPESTGTRRQATGETVPVYNKPTRSHSQIGTVTRMPAFKSRDEFDHPARFPVELPRVYIEACTDPGDYVYEPFCGSGSTLIACEQSARKCLGVELDPHYCDIILSRWEKLTGNLAERITA